MEAIIALLGADRVTVLTKIACLILFGGLFIWFARMRREDAHRDTQQGRAGDQSRIDDSNRQIFDDAKRTEQDVEDWINKKDLK